jgi:hypothetical protein
MMRLSPKLIALVLLFVSTSALSIKLYKWEDASGNVYYGQTVPKGVHAEIVGEPPPPPSFAPDANKPFVDEIEQSLKKDKIKQRQQEEAKQQAMQKKSDKAACEEARDNLGKMYTWRRAQSVGPDGQLTIMSEEEKQARIDEAQELVDEYCK